MEKTCFISAWIGLEGSLDIYNIPDERSEYMKRNSGSIGQMEGITLYKYFSHGRKRSSRFVLGSSRHTIISSAGHGDSSSA